MSPFIRAMPLLVVGALLLIGCAAPGGASVPLDRTPPSDLTAPLKDPSPSASASPVEPQAATGSSGETAEPEYTTNWDCYGAVVNRDGPPSTIAFLMTYNTAVVIADVRSIEEGIFNTRDGGPPDPPRGAGQGYDLEVQTPVNLAVSSVLYGPGDGGARRVVNDGGKAGCVEYDVQGAPRLEIGRTYAFFLSPSAFTDGRPRPELPEIRVAWPVSQRGMVATPEDGLLTLEELAKAIEAATP